MTELNGSGDLAGAQATGANGDRLDSPVDVSLDLADIGLPHSVGLAVGVGDVVTEGHALSAYTAFCHLSIPPLRLLFRTFFVLFA